MGAEKPETVNEGNDVEKPGNEPAPVHAFVRHHVVKPIHSLERLNLTHTLSLAWSQKPTHSFDKLKTFRKSSRAEMITPVNRQSGVNSKFTRSFAGTVNPTAANSKSKT